MEQTDRDLWLVRIKRAIAELKKAPPAPGAPTEGACAGPREGRSRRERGAIATQRPFVRDRVAAAQGWPLDGPTER